MPSFVYLAESPEVMKVGFSVSPADRIMVFPRRFGRFSLLATWPGGKREEEKLIQALIGNYQRIYGREWFYRDSRFLGLQQGSWVSL